MWVDCRRFIFGQEFGQDQTSVAIGEGTRFGKKI